MKRIAKKSGGKASPPSAPPKISVSNFAVGASPSRKWLFRLLALIVLPLLFLAGLEVILRLGGYGYSPAFFKTVHIQQKNFLVNNEDFSRRFFPVQLARWPEPVMLAAVKPVNTFRIFVLGESAAKGEPIPAYAASRYLQCLLSGRFPQTHFEVVNLGITAINSHVVLPIARDCARAGGDIWIIYLGNNEMVGPFGAATVFGAKSPPLEFVRLNLAIQKLRLGQLLLASARAVSARNAPESWGGMQMFSGNALRADDLRKSVACENFAQNLNDIIKVGLDSGAKILLNTVAVNLKDCPPFASLPKTNLTAPQIEQFKTVCAAAAADQAAGSFLKAAGEWQSAAQLDPLVADIHYHWAECLESDKNVPAAREQYQLACDDDALPFRADSRINEIIRTTARKFAGDKMFFYDAAENLPAGLASQVCGSETFYEHVHFNFDGNFRLGRAWAEQVEKILPAKILQNASINARATQEQCERWLALTDWNRGAVTQMMIERLQHPPLAGQANNAVRLQALRAQAEAMRRKITAATMRADLDVYLAAVNRSPEDPFLHRNFAEFLESAGDLKQAGTQWRCIQGLLPENYESFYQAGRLSSKLGKWDQAEPEIIKALSLHPGLAAGWFELGNIRMSKMKYGFALENYRQALRLEPKNAVYLTYAGQALSKLNRPAEAIQYYQRALQLNADLWEAHFALGDELSAANRFSVAEQEYAQVVNLRPDYAAAHFNRGVMLARLNIYADAATEFQAALRLDPQNQAAKEYLNQMERGRPQLPVIGTFESASPKPGP